MTIATIATITTITLTVDQTATWEQDSRDGEAMRRAIRRQATQPGKTVEIRSADGITLDAITTDAE